MPKAKSNLSIVPRHEESHAERLLHEIKELKTAYDKLFEQTKKALLRCLEERDAYTYGHSVRVRDYATLIAEAAGLNQKDLHTLGTAALFHDIGKIGIPDCVLLKSEGLNSEEEDMMQKHPIKGEKILSEIDAFKPILDAVKHHHERMDGQGYPDKLTEIQIPLFSKIILVADSFDAMTSFRPYRDAMPVEAAYAELERCTGTQFDPHFVKIFLREHKKLIHIKKAA